MCVCARVYIWRKQMHLHTSTARLRVHLHACPLAWVHVRLHVCVCICGPICCPCTQVSLSLVPHTLLGAALSLLLVFRTNSSYARFVEGRMLWGTLVRCARNWIRLAATYMRGDIACRAARYIQVSLACTHTHTDTRTHAHACTHRRCTLPLYEGGVVVALHVQTHEHTHKRIHTHTHTHAHGLLMRPHAHVAVRAACLAELVTRCRKHAWVHTSCHWPCMHCVIVSIV